MSNSLKLLRLSKRPTVIFLTLLLIFSVFLSSCSWVSRKTFDYVGEECKTHAYINNDLEEYVTQRFGSKSQARLGIIPFSVQANFSGWGPHKSDWGYDLAVFTHQQLLASGKISMVEVLDRRDWPGKNEEFFSGNFGAIQAARNAGYDLVLVGLQESLKNNSELSIITKIIDTDSGITVWYGKSVLFSYRPEIEKSAAYIDLSIRRPDLVYTPESAQILSGCIAKAIVPEDPEPESCPWPWC